MGGFIVGQVVCKAGLAYRQKRACRDCVPTQVESTGSIHKSTRPTLDLPIFLYSVTE